MPTTISDLIVPEVYKDHMIQESVKSNAFLNSGIATSDGSVTLVGGGKTVNIPFFEQMDTQSEVLSETRPLTVNKITSSKDVACVHARGMAWAASDLSRLFSGADPMSAIAAQNGQQWSNNFTGMLLSTFQGIFALPALQDNVMDNSANSLDKAVMADSMFLLGDKYRTITAIAMHSKVLAKLKNLDLLDPHFHPQDLSLSYYTYMEKRVIVDDSLVPTGSGTNAVYPIYLFGNGAIAYNESSELATVETDRDKLEGYDYLITRRVFTLHPRGVKWLGASVVGETPDNTELADVSNWALVEKPKNVRIALLKTKV